MSQNKQMLACITGHFGTEGYEKTNELAKANSSAMGNGLEPYPSSLCAEALNRWVEDL